MKKTDNIKCPRCLGDGEVPNPKTIGRRLKRLRKKAGLSLTAICDAMGVSHGYLSQVESGTGVPTITVARIRQYEDAVANLTKH